MSYRILYTTEPKRIISGVIMDSRFTIPALAGLGGFAVKRYVDDLIVQVSSGELVYKIETFEGQMAGVFALRVTNNGLNVENLFTYLRPAFQSLGITINLLVSSWVQNGDWKPDFLV